VKWTTEVVIDQDTGIEILLAVFTYPVPTDRAEAIRLACDVIKVESEFYSVLQVEYVCEEMGPPNLGGGG